VLGQIDIDEFCQREAAWYPLLAAEAIELALEGIDRVLFIREAAALDPS
jgi:hypothetical protein